MTPFKILGLPKAHFDLCKLHEKANGDYLNMDGPIVSKTLITVTETEQ